VQFTICRSVCNCEAVPLNDDDLRSSRVAAYDYGVDSISSNSTISGVVLMGTGGAGDDGATDNLCVGGYNDGRACGTFRFTFVKLFFLIFVIFLDTSDATSSSSTTTTTTTTTTRCLQQPVPRLPGVDAVVLLRRGGHCVRRAAALLRHLRLRAGPEALPEQLLRVLP
jgi:hypothetical protein